jgi:RNA polymerase sigma-70 factor (ECF subfamily)
VTAPRNTALSASEGIGAASAARSDVIAMLATPEGSEAHAQTEQEIVTRAQRGDVSAFESLYRSLAPRIHALCVRMSGDPERAVELLQDIFVRIWDRMDQYRGDAAFSTWAHTLAVRAILEQDRADARRNARVTLSEYADAAGPRDDADSRMDLERAIAGLTPALRRVFVLHDVEGYSHVEIAHMTGLATGTLRAQLYHARRQLMEVLNR